MANHFFLKSAWSEAQHPRHPAGAVGGRGGEFAAMAGDIAERVSYLLDPLDHDDRRTITREQAEKNYEPVARLTGTSLSQTLNMLSREIGETPTMVAVDNVTGKGITLGLFFGEDTYHDFIAITLIAKRRPDAQPGETARWATTTGIGTIKVEYVDCKTLSPGAGGRMMASAITLGLEFGAEKMTFLANVDTGACAWARYGFLPTLHKTGESHVWNTVRTTAKTRLQRLASNYQLPPEVVAGATKLLDSPNPKMIQAVATLDTEVPQNYGDAPMLDINNLKPYVPARSYLGRELLRGQKWESTLYMSDTAGIERVRSSLKRKFQ